LRYLKKELSTEEDPDRLKQIKYLVQRMVRLNCQSFIIHLSKILIFSSQENQKREKLKVTKAKEALSDEKRRNRELLKEGKKPEYLSNAERKAKDLVKKYEELTQSGKLDNYIKRKEKKNLSKDRKRIKL
jgi:ribosomal RNA-processing protein 36